MLADQVFDTWYENDQSPRRVIRDLLQPSRDLFTENIVGKLRDCSGDNQRMRSVNKWTELLSEEPLEDLLEPRHLAFLQ